MAKARRKRPPKRGVPDAAVLVTIGDLRAAKRRLDALLAEAAELKASMALLAAEYPKATPARAEAILAEAAKLRRRADAITPEVQAANKAAEDLAARGCGVLRRAGAAPSQQEGTGHERLC